MEGVQEEKKYLCFFVFSALQPSSHTGAEPPGDGGHPFPFPRPPASLAFAPFGSFPMLLQQSLTSNTSTSWFSMLRLHPGFHQLLHSSSTQPSVFQFFWKNPLMKSLMHPYNISVQPCKMALARLRLEISLPDAFRASSTRLHVGPPCRTMQRSAP